MTTSTNTMPSIKERILAVCDRLEIPTSVGSYEGHMGMALESLKEEGVKPKVYHTLTYAINKGVRHCDYFDILYRMLIEDRHIESAINDIIEEFVEADDYVDTSEFYGFMYAVNREDQYRELWMNWYNGKEEVKEESKYLVHTSHEIGGGKIGHVSYMNEVRDDEGNLIDSWVDEIPDDNSPRIVGRIELPEDSISSDCCCGNCGGTIGKYDKSYIMKIRDEVYGTWNDVDFCEYCYCAEVENQIFNH